MPPSVVLIGQSERAEFSPVSASLQVNGVQVWRWDSTATGPDVPPASDLWIVCQSWPDEFSLGNIGRILNGAATARLVCVYGEWCASDGRTRDLWPLAIRVPVHEFAARLRFELDVIAGRAAPLPLTAARDECFAVRCRS